MLGYADVQVAVVIWYSKMQTFGDLPYLIVLTCKSLLFRSLLIHFNDKFNMFLLNRIICTLNSLCIFKIHCLIMKNVVFVVEGEAISKQRRRFSAAELGNL